MTSAFLSVLVACAAARAASKSPTESLFRGRKGLQKKAPAPFGGIGGVTGDGFPVGGADEEIKTPPPLISASRSAGVNEKTARGRSDGGAAAHFLRNFKKNLSYWLELLGLRTIDSIVSEPRKSSVGSRTQSSPF